jgi:hypothetical protein
LLASGQIEERHVKTTLNIEDDLLGKAQRVSGLQERSAN